MVTCLYLSPGHNKPYSGSLDKTVRFFTWYLSLRVQFEREILAMMQWFVLATMQFERESLDRKPRIDLHTQLDTGCLAPTRSSDFGLSLLAAIASTIPRRIFFGKETIGWLHQTAAAANPQIGTSL
ncbi:hypothetical protein LINPERHAP1_LOCUS36807 [Linum perenne]